MNHRDDPAIDGDVVLLRRIPPKADRVQWDENGAPSPASQNFKDKDDELSVYLAQETSYEAVLYGHDGYGLVHFIAGGVRQLFSRYKAPLVICRDDLDPAQGHVLICGKVTNGMAKEFKRIVNWVPGRWPARLPPEAW